MIPTLEHIEAPGALPDNPFTLTPSDRFALFGAHPDDIAVLMSYAAAEALARLGPEHVYTYVATDGEASTLGDPEAVSIHRDRRVRAQTELLRLGGEASHVHLPNLGDGKLDMPGYYKRLAADVKQFIAENGITVAITFGREGCDGHKDHCAVHRAVAEAAGEIAVWALRVDGKGEARIPADPRYLAYKLHAIAASDDQFPMQRLAGGELPAGWTERAGFAIPPETAEYLAHYEQFLTKGETYSLVHPAHS